MEAFILGISVVTVVSALCVLNQERTSYEAGALHALLMVDTVLRLQTIEEATSSQCEASQEEMEEFEIELELESPEPEASPQVEASSQVEASLSPPSEEAAHPWAGRLRQRHVKRYPL
jgi:hypothetical protein